MKHAILILVMSSILSGCWYAQQSSQPPQDLAKDSSTSELTEFKKRITPLEERRYQDIILDDVTMTVEVVDTWETVQLGLSYRDEIGADGMLFVMPQSRGIPAFWMKGMLFDLDMIWIDCSLSDHERQKMKEGIGNSQRDALIGASAQIGDDECLVVDVTRGAKAPKDAINTIGLPTYNPQFPVTHVLEIEVSR